MKSVEAPKLTGGHIKQNVRSST